MASTYTNPGARADAAGFLEDVHASRLNTSSNTASHDLAQLRDELRQQQKLAFQAAMRAKLAEHDGNYLGLPTGFLSVIASIELTMTALNRIEREGGL